MISALPYHTSASTQKQHHNYDLTSFSANKNNNKNNHTTTTANTDYLQPQVYQFGQQSQLSPQFETSSSSDPASSPSSTDFEGTDNGLDNWLLANSMQSESWGPLAQQFTPKMSRFSHQRESSLSSLGSTGPASPFNHNTSNPQIAVSDSASDGLHDMQAHDAQGNYYQLAKSLGSFPGYQNFDPAMPEMAYPIMPGSNGKGRLDRTMLPAPDFHNVPNRSHPASVASSLASDSPATPTNGETENDRRRKGFNNNVPRLDRTMTDVYGDELFNPNFSITSSSPSQQTMAVSPSRNNDLFNQRINAANSQHLSSTHSPASSTSRDKSPFLNGSPHAPAINGSNDMMGSQQGMHHFGAAQRIRQQGKDAQLLQQQMGNAAGEPETPKTISPKDAILEFNEADGDANFPLFPQDSTNFDMDQLTKSMIPPMSTADVSQSMLATHNGGAMNQIPYLQSQLAAGLQIPQYNFMPRQQPSHDTPPRLSSAGSSSAGSGPNTPVNRSRPVAVGADGGTYTCTYHGCTLRFETPALLQKHKREGHRATQGFGNPRPSDVGGMTSSLLNSQAGPHRCDRINPSTGKPCSTVFSRPYDLTRHEDTIHNARKQKVRCNLCTEEKTFSRADALTRHYRVCHPDMELPGKHRRRGGV